MGVAQIPAAQQLAAVKVSIPRFSITPWILANNITGDLIVLSDDESSEDAESDTDYDDLDLDLIALVADCSDDRFNKNESVDKNQCVPSTDRQASASPCHDSLTPYTTEPPLLPKAAKASAKYINYDGPDEPGDDDIFDVFAEDEANKTSKDARPAKRRTTRRKLSPTSYNDPTSNSATRDPHDGRRDYTQSPQPCPAAGAVQQSDSRSSPLLERRHREGVARSDAHNRSTSRIDLGSAASMPSTTLETTGVGELQPGALVTDSDQDWEIRNIIDRKVVDGEVHYWVDWEPTWMPKSELYGAKESVDGFVARLQNTQRESGSGNGRGKRPLKRGQQEIRGSDTLSEAEPKKRRGRPRKQI